METRDHKHEGRNFRVTQLGDESWSVICLNPNFDDNDIDYTQWPNDEIVSKWIGKLVRLSDAGDHPDYPEAIFTTVDDD